MGFGNQKNQTDVAKVARESEVKNLVLLDSVPWYKRKNLRTLYLCLVPAALGCEMTSGVSASYIRLSPVNCIIAKG